LAMARGNEEEYQVRNHLMHDHARLSRLRREAGDPAGSQEEGRRALAVADELIDAKPDVGAYRFGRAKCLQALGDLLDVRNPAAASACYRQAFELLPILVADAPGIPQYREALAEVHVAIGARERAEGRSAEATEHFRAARDLLTALATDLPDGGPGPGLPGNNENSLAWFLANCPDPAFRDPARAVDHAKTAVLRAPRHADYWNTLGAAHYRAGDPTQAAAALEKAVELRNGGDGCDWLLLAAARWRLGQSEPAKTALAQADAQSSRYQGREGELRALQEEVRALMVATKEPATR
jgi:tetratricopeptide (TPR) repeat protein